MGVRARAGATADLEPFEEAPLGKGGTADPDCCLLRDPEVSVTATLHQGGRAGVCRSLLLPHQELDAVTLGARAREWAAFSEGRTVLVTGRANRAAPLSLGGSVEGVGTGLAAAGKPISQVTSATTTYHAWASGSYSVCKLVVF